MTFNCTNTLISHDQSKVLQIYRNNVQCISRHGETAIHLQSYGVAAPFSRVMHCKSYLTSP